MVNENGESSEKGLTGEEAPTMMIEEEDRTSTQGDEAIKPDGLDYMAHSASNDVVKMENSQDSEWEDRD
ncbi:hypothetical protein L6452_09314 [Arctium lappa]|uniref:Uncharacterized protein n=1 Tax=Arctium lappa TaxID=4217 RepID=A0ACB9DJY0_ARCLA|nr:hypothetical protein L6452_09314 [Arctium lappa]